MLIPRLKSIFAAVLLLGMMLLSSKTIATDNEHTSVTKNRPGLVIDDIICRGNQSSNCDFIIKKYYQQPGDILDPEEVADARLRLGTLIQFRHIDIRLEKGHQRGYVIVVFDVLEASNIQYEWGTGFKLSRSEYNSCFTQVDWDNNPYTQCTAFNQISKDLNLGGAITDFNFFGSGKRLSFGINLFGGDNHSNSDSNFFGIQPSFKQTNYTNDTKHRGYGFSLDYYDPHIFDSTHYYGRFRITHSRSSQDTSTEIISEDGHDYQLKTSRSPNLTPYQIELGRRFGSHSYLSFDLNKVINRSPTYVKAFSVFGLNYGWDSTDNSLFASKGSQFNTRLTHNRYDNADALSFNYKMHHSLWYNKVVSWSLNAKHTRNRTNHRFDAPEPLYRNSTSYGFSLRYTQIYDIDPLEGTYSGWFTELQTSKSNLRPESFPDVAIAINFGYTFQTASMIYRFTIGLSSLRSL